MEFLASLRTLLIGLTLFGCQGTFTKRRNQGRSKKVTRIRKLISRDTRDEEWVEWIKKGPFEGGLLKGDKELIFTLHSRGCCQLWFFTSSSKHSTGQCNCVSISTACLSVCLLLWHLPTNSTGRENDKEGLQEFLCLLLVLGAQEEEGPDQQETSTPASLSCPWSTLSMTLH